MLPPQTGKARFAQQRQALDAYLGRVRAGESAEAEFRTLVELSREMGIAILLGPTQSLSRDDASQAREQPDALDIRYYASPETRALAEKIFVQPLWGDVQVEFRVLSVQGNLIPSFRVTWADTAAYMFEIWSDAFTQDMGARVKLFATLSGASAFNWRAETIRE